MAAEIETLKNYSLEELEEYLDKMSKELPQWLTLLLW